MAFEYNKDIETRDSIIFGNYRPGEYHGGIRRFRELDVETLEKLIEEKFIDPEDCQNLSPTAWEFFNFMKQYPWWMAHGYVVELKRPDYRMTIEGIETEMEPHDPEELCEYSKLCGDADDFQTTYCWYD